MLALLLALAAVTATVDRGNIVLRDGSTTRTITRDGAYREPVLSPDGTRVAFIHQDAPSGGSAMDGPLTSLWIADVAGGAPRRLLAPRPADDPQHSLDSFDNIHWSLDGSYLYVDAAAWATSAAIHQIDVRTGREHFVIDGWSFGVIRNGPWRGYLLVGQHKYYNRPSGGSYNPVSLVRPDGSVIQRIPGSAADEGERSVPRWLKSHGWIAS